MLTHSKVFSAADEGRTLSRPWVKNPSVVTGAGIAVDLTFFGRYPAANYLTDGTPLAARALRRSTDGGLDHGEDKGAGYRKFLAGATILTVTAGAVPLPVKIMDYLLYYPLIPMEDVQTMDNTIGLPRYADGRGVQIMLVEQFPYVGGGTCRVNYTNSDGVAGRLSPIMTINAQTALGDRGRRRRRSSEPGREQRAIAGRGRGCRRRAGSTEPERERTAKASLPARRRRVAREPAGDDRPRSTAPESAGDNHTSLSRRSPPSPL